MSEGAKASLAKPIPPGHKEGYKCVTCGKVFRTKDDTTSHISKVHSTGSFKKVLMKTDTKPKPHKTIESIKIPRKSPVKLYRCKICMVVHKTRSLIEQHCIGLQFYLKNNFGFLTKISGCYKFFFRFLKKKTIFDTTFGF